jgi:hypothetical protein
MRLGVALASALVALVIPVSAQAEVSDNLLGWGDEGPLLSRTGYDEIPFGFTPWRKMPDHAAIIPVA